VPADEQPGTLHGTRGLLQRHLNIPQAARAVLWGCGCQRALRQLIDAVGTRANLNHQTLTAAVTVGFPCPPRKYTAAIRYCSDRGALRGAALVVQLPATDTSCWPELSNRYLDLLERKDRPGRLGHSTPGTTLAIYARATAAADRAAADAAGNAFGPNPVRGASDE